MSGTDVVAGIRSLVIDSVRAFAEEGVYELDGEKEDLLKAVTLDSPRDSDHGDLATNACLVLAKAARMPPREVAALLATRLEADARIVSAEIAGPGFVNLTVKHVVWEQAARGALDEGKDYGRSDLGQSRKVNVEYVSANPTGPLHVGHGRGAVVGDAIASLLAFAGFDVTREYYINDAGGQIDQLARSLYSRYLEALNLAGEGVDFPYPGEYLVPPAVAFAEKHGRTYAGEPEEKWLPTFREAGIKSMMALVRSDLEALGISHDIFSSERVLRDSGRVDEVVTDLEKKNLIYTGELERPKGHDGEWESRPQLLFRAESFGDDTDRPLRRANGEWTYFASDLAYHRDKWRRGFADQVDVWGADHGGYVKRVEAGLDALSGGEASLDVKLCQLVRITRDGKPVRMSKREGDMVSLEVVIEAVGKDVFRFLMLTRKPDAPLDFDLAEAIRRSKDNPVYYVQYAHARIRSAFRRAATETDFKNFDPLAEGDFAKLSDVRETALMKRVAFWPRAVASAAEHREPHRIAFFLGELASEFHALWTMGSREDTSLRILVPDDRELTATRLALAEAVRTVLACGLSILGVSPVEEMR